MKREDLLATDGYWIAKIQTRLFAELDQYFQEHPKSQTAFAKKLGVTKGYISQILNGNFDHKISKLCELSLAIGKVPELVFHDLKTWIENDKIGIDQTELNRVNLIVDFSNQVIHEQESQENFELS